MKKIKEIFAKINKKILFIVLGAIAGIALITGLVFLGIHIFKGKSQEEILTDKMKDMAASFYKDFYYEQVGSNEEERTEFLKKYEKLGFKVNLDNLSRYKGDDSEKILKDFVNDKTNKKCDKYKSQAIIYPKKPYKNNSFTIKIELDCGFKK